jgi:hypothetical protein
VQSTNSDRHFAWVSMVRFENPTVVPPERQAVGRPYSAIPRAWAVG